MISVDRRTSIVLPMLIVAVAYGIWLGGQLPLDHPERLGHIGQTFLDQGRGASAAIDRLAPQGEPGNGYDGQFFVFMAIDLGHASAYLDEPAYRMTRIGFPVTAGAVVGNQQSAVPWAMLGLELLSVIATTGLIAAMVTAAGGSAWLALLYGLSPGLFLSATRLVSEAPANALAALGMLLWLRYDRTPSRGSLAVAGCAFAAAALTRETTLLFPIGIALWMVLSSTTEGIWTRARPALLLTTIAVLPLLVWQGFLLWWLPQEQIPEAARFQFIPFGGLVADGRSFVPVGQIVSVVVPCCIAVAVTLLGTRWSVWSSVIGLNFLVLVVFLPHHSYDDLGASARITLAVILAFVLALPRIQGRLRSYGVVAAGVLWMLPWIYLLPAKVL